MQWSPCIGSLPHAPAYVLIIFGRDGPDNNNITRKPKKYNKKRAGMRKKI